MWRVAANILNNQSRQPTRDGPPNFGLGERLAAPHLKKACYEMLNRAPVCSKDKLRVFENRVLKIFGPKREEVVRDCRDFIMRNSINYEGGWGL
jgi:hypothetical protein